MDYKQEAKKIVEMFQPYAMQYFHDQTGWDEQSLHNNAVQCAMIYERGIMSEVGLERWDYHNNILNQLKQM